MDMRQLTYIVTIADEGGVTRAAAKLFVTQSALDQQLIKLENELGVQLFIRARNSFALTRAGEVYVDYARRILSLKNEAYMRIADMADQQRGTLSIAFAPERGMEMFAAVYPVFYDQYPEITVIPREISVKKQLELLKKEELDLCFVYMPDASIPGVVCEKLAEEEFVLITPKNHPLAKKAGKSGKKLKTVKAQDMEYLTYSIMYRESTQRDVLDPMFKKFGIKPNIFLETGSNRANISMAEKGLSCSVVPYFYARNNERVAIFRIQGRPSWQIYACWRSGQYKSKAAERFIALARNYFDAQMIGVEEE